MCIGDSSLKLRTDAAITVSHNVSMDLLRSNLHALGLFWQYIYDLLTVLLQQTTNNKTTNNRQQTTNNKQQWALYQFCSFGVVVGEIFLVIQRSEVIGAVFFVSPCSYLLVLPLILGIFCHSYYTSLK
jgi:hypothetical protein